MRAVIDARPALDPGRTGVGHYTQQLVRHLPTVDPEDRYVAWYLHARGLFRHRRFFADVGAPNLEESSSRFPARVFQPLSWRARLPRVEWLVGDFDVLLATNFLPPPTRHMERTVLVVHDLAWAVYPETAPQIDDRWRRRLAKAVRSCGAVIVPSVSAKGDLVGRYDVPEERVHAVAHGVDASAFGAVTDAEIGRVRDRFQIDGSYVLFVGGLEPRKNLVTLVRAFADSGVDATLVIAGGRVRWFPAEEARVWASVRALSEPARSRVLMTGYVSDEDKHVLLAGADALAFPSLYEGFGFPVIEAMAAGTPVLTSNVSSLPEIAGEDAVLVDPKDVHAIAHGLRRVLTDGPLRERLIGPGRARAAGFTWEATARRTAEVLRSVAATARG
ncbi:MAG TPA: glycosyltransferase family 1 protein [Actinomycetota bacterium]|nr:glycosyltransferase family 1 protein [Actinomycetota bacterium]